ncbi:hypothetical protein J2T09_004845 [Neorhizobium huautlense]|uniref:Exopolysaccharide biosynthesis protein n=1 Tax=Neorhizobium huautlense TaxID=67774 RepID=A0ABT9Q0R4_9HYPH|nr:exopolysaccharide biosynthesis protein [Neorhizobium huautlense]MDP9840065.1 hypothetical protein [Neorhizobium huautlense]
MGEKKLAEKCAGKGFSDLIARLTALADSSDRISVHEIREEIGERSFGPFLIIPAIIEISPIGGIPGVPTAIAIIISLFAVQILVGRKHLWLPQILERQTLDGQKLKNGLGKLSTISRHCEKILRPHMNWATRPPYLQLLAAVVILLCVSVPPLEFIPFASTAPMLAVMMVGIALLMRDGLAAVIASVMAAASGYLVWSMLAA